MVGKEFVRNTLINISIVGGYSPKKIARDISCDTNGGSTDGGTLGPEFGSFDRSITLSYQIDCSLKISSQNNCLITKKVET